MVIFSFIKWPKAFLFFSFLPPQPPEEFLGFSLRTRPHPRPCPSQLRLLSYIPLAVYASRLFRNIKCSCPLAWWCFIQGPRYISSPVSAQAPRCSSRSQCWLPDCWRHAWQGWAQRDSYLVAGDHSGWWDREGPGWRGAGAVVSGVSCAIRWNILLKAAGALCSDRGR